MKYIIAILALALTGCASSGRITSYETDPATGLRTETIYSEYFQCIDYIADGRVKSDVLLTLGKERLPKDYSLIGYAPKRFNRAQGDIEGVLEVYFTNVSDQPIDLELIEIEDMKQKMDMAPRHVSLQPGAYIKTEPLVRFSTIYRGHPSAYSLTYKYQGSIQILTGTIRRLTVDELKANAQKK